jgi:hypothetical protein
MKNKLGIRTSFLPAILGTAVFLAGSAFAPSGRAPAAENNAAAPAGSAASGVGADSLIRIYFAAGTTSGTVSGSLNPAEVQSYVLWAAWNQVMIANVNSGDGNSILEIYGNWDGYSLCWFSSALTSWSGSLTRSQDYIIKVKNNGGSTQNYSLFIEIPARIQFAPGAYSGSVWGRGSVAQTISYVLWARAGQTMTASLSSSTGTVYLNIYGFSGGQSLVNSSSSQTSWSGNLPQSQDYIVDAVQGGTWTDFTLTVTII